MNGPQHFLSLETCRFSVEDRDWTQTEVDRKHNLALGKPTSQSSTPDRKHASSNAVDGNVNPDAGQGSCALTEGATDGSWWQVNLETVRQVREVVITSRNDRGRKFSMSSIIHNFTL